MHWLLMPSGFRKKNFPSLYQAFELTRIEAFLRWVVAAQTPLGGINDIKEEHDGKNVVDVTIKYNNLEWSMSCSPGCLQGSHGGQPPHYHFQMRIDGRPFIDYSDHHIPLADDDLWMIDVKLGKNPQVVWRELYGMGIGAAREEVEPEALLSYMRTAKDESAAPFRLQTMIAAEPGNTISGEKIMELIEESKSTGIPLAQLARKLDGVSVSTVITPGDGIPAAAKRTARKRGRGRKK